MPPKSKKFEASALSSVGLQIPDSSTALLDHLIHKITVPLVNEGDEEGLARGYPSFDPERNYRVGDRVAIPLELIAENPLNPRVFFNSEKSSLVQSLKESGQLVPVMVYPCGPDGKFVLKSGHRRAKALQALGRPYIKAEIVAQGENVLDEFVQARAINVEQQEQSVLDDCVSFKKLLEAQVVKSQYQLSVAVGIPETTLSKYISIAGLPAEVLDAMAEDPDKFRFSMAYQVHQAYARWSDTPRVLELIHKIRQEGYSTREVEEMLQKGASEVSARKLRSSPLARTKFSRMGTGELKAFDDKLVLKLADLTPELRETLYNTVLEALTAVQQRSEQTLTPQPDPSGS
jgi:ParB family chromosome partitioning protein